MTTGEEIQHKGEIGASRAKRWLERTSRADVHWVNPDTIAKEKLEFEWCNHTTFSFDLGGVFTGSGDNVRDSLEGKNFLAEVKFYEQASDQGVLFVDFLAKCYRAKVEDRRHADIFLWISWAPFSVGKWRKLHSSDEIRSALLSEKNYERALGVNTRDQARDVLQRPEVVALCEQLADNIWVIILSENEEKYLSLSAEELSFLIQRRILNKQRGQNEKIES